MTRSAIAMDDPRRWDIFCNVVDNYGDIGVCWRLARQLADEYELAVRLWVDDLTSLAKLHPAADPGREAQQLAGVEVHRWSETFPDVAPAACVIDGFGCRLPENYLAAMAGRRPAPVWFNLEYLSAEPWVEGCHGLCSPRPELSLQRHFFFPGFTAATGGLLCERDLLARRDAFRVDAAARTAFWSAIGMPLPAGHDLTVSLFSYENGNIAGLLDLWSAGAAKILCLVPEGRALPQVAAWLGEARVEAGRIFTRGSLELRVLPFVAQDDYDRLLWQCDANFVRGEDSVVRAQWAASPMVWQIYPQQEEAHWPKLDAFLELYAAGLSAGDAAALRDFWHAWNRGDGAAAAWPGFAEMLPRLHLHAANWCRHLAAHAGGNLAANLVAFFQRIAEYPAP